MYQLAKSTKPPTENLRQHFDQAKPPPVHQGDCIAVMRGMLPGSVDFILTDPPYLARYKDRAGCSIQNDAEDAWLKPAFAEMHRVLKRDAFAVSFYGWPKADRFMAAWREAGFRVAGHLVFRKRYASKSAFLRYSHEQAYLLVKGRPAFPDAPPLDVIDMPYTGNKLHPTQKPIAALKPLIEAFSRSGDTVLDPFAGSGSTLLAAHLLGREAIGIEIDSQHCAAATGRIARTLENAARRAAGSQAARP